MAADNPLTPLLDALQQAIVPPTTAASSFPSPSDLAFERTLSRRLANNLDSESDRILTLANRVLNWATSNPNLALDSDLIKDGLYNQLTQPIEQLLEHADDSIDKHLGQGKHRTSTVGAVGAKSAQLLEEKERERAKRDRLPARLLHDSSLEKPQTKFTARTSLPVPKIGEEAEGVPLWKPLLRRKVNALGGEEAEGWLRTEVYQPTSSFSTTTNTTPPSYTRYIHPYADELAALAPPSSFLAKPEKPQPHAKNSFDKTPFEWVADSEALERMVDEIREVGKSGMKDLAIDLEHHDFRTWNGITCLIQLSTRNKDYVIDALDPAVRDTLDLLNEFFTDPEWVKVLHGANSDIVWLQRDFGLYIVGLFDTYHATKILGYAQHSLASLLDMYTDFEPDKRYQLADWRIRPLSKDMLHYARSDTHFLLSIYDHLRRALHSKATSSPPSPTDPSPLKQVFARSKSVSGITHSLAPFDHQTGFFDSGFLLPLAKHGQLKAYSTAVAVPTLPIKTGWGPREGKFEVLRAVVRWREEIAREEDESPRFVLSVGGVWQLAELGGVGRIKEGREVVQVLGGARGGVSEVVRKRKDELAGLLQETWEAVAGRTGGDEPGADVEMGQAAVQAVQIGMAAQEPSVRPVGGLWGEEEQATVASSSSVIVAAASQSSFYGSAISRAPSAAQPSPQIAVSTSSSFFGSTSPQAASSSATSSSSKAKGKRPILARNGSSSRDLERAAAVEKVHASLVLGGGLAQSLQAHVIPVTATPASPAMDVDLETALESTDPTAPPPFDLTASADHTYVPLSGRVPKPEQPSLLDADSRAPKMEQPKAKDSDVLVVSAMKDRGTGGTGSTGKKRKRVAGVVPTADSSSSTSLTDPSATASTSTSTPSNLDEATSPPPAHQPAPKKIKKSRAERAALAASIVPHDYSTSSSILDAKPTGAAGAQRREMDKKARKKEARAEQVGKVDRNAIDTSAFGRAPRVNNAPKKAAKAMSFAAGGNGRK
ncbi:hypothetical protein JCM11641_000716 [Rhodosporidiobolus odoratus]